MTMANPSETSIPTDPEALRAEVERLTGLLDAADQVTRDAMELLCIRLSDCENFSR